MSRIAVTIRERSLFGAVLLLLVFCGAAAAQPQGAALERWSTVPGGSTPVASGQKFDLAFGADQRPVLAVVDTPNGTLSLKKWDGTAWNSLTGLSFSGQAPLRAKMASDWTGDIVVGLLMTSGGNLSFDVYQLRGAQLTQLGVGFRVPDVTGYALAIDARGPVIAWQSSGFVRVRRWNGIAWGQLGPSVNPSINIFNDPQSPTLAVTGDGKLVVGYALRVGDAVGIAAKVWDGTGWTALGTGVAPPARAVTLGGETSGAPVAAYLTGAASRVSRWNGSTWEPIGQPCMPTTVVAGVFGVPSLAVRGNQPLVVCGIHLNPTTITGRRTLVARGWSRIFGWEPLGGGPINGKTALADANDLVYVIRSDPSGRPWVAWTAQSGVFVSTLLPAPLSSGP
jgi:hypothetical protein